MPSAVFFLIYIIVYSSEKILFLTKESLIKDIDEVLLSLDLFFKLSFSVVIVVVAFLGLSYILSLLTQVIFDNNIKRKYNANTYLFWKEEENKELDLLRQKVINKIEEENKDIFPTELLKNSDMFLYQVVGRKLQFFSKETKTNRYVDETKSAGILFVSIMLSLCINMFIFNDIYVWKTVLNIILIGAFFFMGREHLKSKYRSRATRIYVNYLLGDEKTVEKEE